MKSFGLLSRVVLLAAGLLAAQAVFADNNSPKSIKHALGEITLNKVPQRVVVLGQGSLDTLDRLGVEPVGVVKSMMPAYLNKYQDEKYVGVGSVVEPDFEAIFMAKPDLIIAEARMTALMDQLSEIAPTIMYSVEYGQYWQDAQQNWRMLGEIFNKQAEAEQLIAETQTKLNAAKQRVKDSKMNALMLMNNGNKLAMFNEGSRFSMVFDDFGFTPARSEKVSAGGPHGNLISFEYVADAKPDAMLVLDREQAIGRDNGKAKARFDNPLVKSTPAYKQNHIVYLNPNAWYITMAGATATELMIDDINALF
ncbi:siderophore ABC transporter substrate-binding protein [Photobacterium galatheae]|uniref:Ferric anguibactin-binding protein n=1 Tax=Photobacterium galatheae TaxID=1654360 RepID=A0A066RVL6_9GAMM|nr:ABC transporter substrate-binding protein [Photobacterium galatheae]KDM91712.1 ferric anguibactin-binding protein [Photobacterium galatheae]MCM0149823.1 ABC transporter substrate-binding protein [Photobacterium galatheae]